MRPAMRVSNHRTGGVLALATLFALSAVVTACGSGPPPSSPPPTAQPTPVITPDPHLSEPATADQIFNAIRVGDLPLSVNNATAGGPDSPIVKVINAQIANWPLIITEYRSSAVLRAVTKWDPAAGPKQGDPPYTWVGLNMMVAFGPVTGKLAPPDASREQEAKDLVALIDPLLWPLDQRSVVPVPTKTAPLPSSAPSGSAAPPASTAP
jgi:hypothetical protein